jgi:hypothetical protein
MNETGDERQRGYYGWQEVIDAKRELRELEKVQEQGSQKSTLEGETSDESNLSSATLPTPANLTISACGTGTTADARENITQ